MTSVVGARFSDDLRASAAVLRGNPWLPAISFLFLAGPVILDAIALVVSGYDPACYGKLRPTSGCVKPGTTAAMGLANLVGFPLLIFSVGWVGSERLWFLRAYRGMRMSVGKRSASSGLFGVVTSFWVFSPRSSSSRSSSWAWQRKTSRCSCGSSSELRLPSTSS
jgi:hypothetical protein